MRQKRILVADDDSRLSTALALRLEQAGYTVVTAQTGFEALMTAIDNKPDLLILDVNMPMGDGFSIQERLKKCTTGRSCPIIVMSGESGEWIEEAAYSLGATYFLSKPFDHQEMVVAVNGILDICSESAA